MLLKGPKKTRMVCMRLTEEQFSMIDDFAKRIYETTGFRITRASIMQKLMHYGLPAMEKEFPPPMASVEISDALPTSTALD